MTVQFRPVQSSRVQHARRGRVLTLERVDLPAYHHVDCRLEEAPWLNLKHARKRERMSPLPLPVHRLSGSRFPTLRSWEIDNRSQSSR